MKTDSESPSSAPGAISPSALPPCGIVMKGGITSGVVYPKAAVALAKSFRFRQIGGTSAGAIAAAATAAAEFRRQNQNGDMAGFDKLEKLPTELGETLPASRQSRLRSLFQPEPATRPIFEVLFRVLESKRGIVHKILSLAYSSAFAFPGWALFGSLPGLFFLLFAFPLLLSPSSGNIAAVWLLVLVAAIVAVTGAASVALVRFVLYIPGTIAKNGYGLCSGYHNGKRSHPDAPPLTEWLYDYLQDLAGLPPNEPLTFGHLQKYGITLQMVTTCVSHGRPYRLPNFSERHRIFLFHPDELRRFFPEAVVQQMVTKARSDKETTEASEAESAVTEEEEKDVIQFSRNAANATSPFCRLPLPDDLPVIVAVRMSLSFPILFSAVPLYSIDRKRNADNRRPEPCWFTDGGVTSNFPMHLFDEPLPEWPVFGINLREFHRDRPGEAVSVVRTNGEGYAPWWTRWEQDSVPGPNATLSQPTNLSGFLMGVANAAQNWSDNLQLTLPGYRERIAHVQLNGDEGGLNLNMSANLITELSSRGQVAADYLRENFTRTADEAAAQPIAKNRTPVTWENHRWWRFRTVFAALQPFLRQVGKRTTGSDTASLRPLLDKIVTADRISYDWPGSNVEQRKEKRAGAVTAAVTLADLVAEWDEEKVDFEEKAPKPSSALRFGPRV